MLLECHGYANPGLKCYPSCFMLKQMIQFSAGGMGRLGCAFTNASLWQIWSWASAAQQRRMPLLPSWWPGLSLPKSKRYRSTLWILRAHQRGELNACTFFVVVCNRDLCIKITKAVSSLVCTRNIYTKDNWHVITLSMPVEFTELPLMKSSCCNVCSTF